MKTHIFNMPYRCFVLLAVALMAAPPIAAQSDDAGRIDRLLDTPPFDRAGWGVILMDADGREIYARNAGRLFVPASTNKLVVSAAASVLLPRDYRAVTSIYGTGPLTDGLLDGDLVIYGRGDPTFSDRCYGADTLAVGACDSLWTRMDLLADRIVATGVRHVAGSIVGDGSHFDANLVHPAWEKYDVNWWYAAPVSGLGFNDNSVNVTWAPGPAVHAPAAVTFEPDLGIFQFENRTRTVPAGERRTIDFFRVPGTMDIWAEGTVPVSYGERTEYFALPDPNFYFAAALRAALAKRGVSIAGPTVSTTDSLRYAHARRSAPLVDFDSRALADMIYPILNSSQNWFAEMLLKTVGRQVEGAGSWRAGLAAERRFLIDSVGIDSTAFALSDGSGLSSGNLITPRAFAQLLQYMLRQPNGAGFMHAMPRSGERGSLRRRFVDTPLEGRVLAKTGSIFRVQTLAGYIERPGQEPLIFSVMANSYVGRYSAMTGVIDSVVVQMGRGR